MNDAINYGNKVDAKVIATSAKSGNGVEELFLELTKSLLNKQNNSAVSTEKTNKNVP